MIRISVRDTFPDAVRRLSALHADIRDKAMAAAINKTMDKARTEMVRQITAEYAIKAGDVRPQLKTTRATAKGARLVGVLEAFGVRRGKRSRNVMLFAARQVTGRATKTIRYESPQGWITRKLRVGGGVSVKIKRSGPRKVIQGAFIGNQGRTVFIREPGAARLPIKGVETVDVPQMFNTRTVNAAVVSRIEREFPVEFDRAARLYLERFNRG